MWILSMPLLKNLFLAINETFIASWRITQVIMHKEMGVMLTEKICYRGLESMEQNTKTAMTSSCARMRVFGGDT